MNKTEALKNVMKEIMQGASDFTGYVLHHVSGGVRADLAIVPHEHDVNIRPSTHYINDTSNLVRLGTDNLNLGDNYLPSDITDQIRHQNRLNQK